MRRGSRLLVVLERLRRHESVSLRRYHVIEDHINLMGDIR